MHILNKIDEYEHELKWCSKWIAEARERAYEQAKRWNCPVENSEVITASEAYNILKAKIEELNWVIDPYHTNEEYYFDEAENRQKRYPEL